MMIVVFAAENIEDHLFNFEGKYRRHENYTLADWKRWADGVRCDLGLHNLMLAANPNPTMPLTDDFFILIVASTVKFMIAASKPHRSEFSMAFSF